MFYIIIFMLEMLFFYISYTVGHFEGYMKCDRESKKVLSESAETRKQMNEYIHDLQKQLTKEKKRTERLSTALFDNGILVHIDEEE